MFLSHRCNPLGRVLVPETILDRNLSEIFNSWHIFSPKILNTTSRSFQTIICSYALFSRFLFYVDTVYFNTDGLLSKWLLARVVKANAKLYNLVQMMLWKEETFINRLNSHHLNFLKTKEWVNPKGWSQFTTFWSSDLPGQLKRRWNSHTLISKAGISVSASVMTP